MFASKSCCLFAALRKLLSIIFIESPPLKTFFLLTGACLSASLAMAAERFMDPESFIDPVQSGRYRSANNLYIFGSMVYDRYRIPSLEQLGNGDVVFFAERRENFYYGFNDFRRQNIIMRTLQSSGKLTGTRTILFSRDAEGSTEDGSNYKHNLMNPVSVYNRDTGVLHLFYNHIVSYKSQDLKLRVYVMHSSSSDNGKNWSTPVNLSDTFGETCEALIVGPGRAIQIPAGEPYASRIVVPLHTVDVPGKNGTRYPEQCNKADSIRRGLFKVAYSDNDTASWGVSNRLDSGVEQGFFTENQIVPLQGQLYMFSRLGGSYEYRGTGLGYSQDGGTCWYRGFNGQGPLTNAGEPVGVTGRFITPTQPGLTTDGQYLYYATSVYYSSDKSLSNRREAWIHRIDPGRMVSRDNSPVDTAQPITKSGFSNAATLYLGNHKIGVLWEEVRTWTIVPSIRSLYYTVFDTRDFRAIDDPAWLGNGFTYFPVANGSRDLLNPDIEKSYQWKSVYEARTLCGWVSCS